MPNLAETIARLAARRKSGANASADRLTDLACFGGDPGNLRARAYVPAQLAPDAALVVVLHGCTQTAAGYDHGSGWSAMADAHGFALLFPEQRRENNPNLCFNWFQPGDIARGSGEAESIRQMVAAMIDAHAIDPARVFVTGLSAGGAMTAVMLAAYPETFAGGAIIAGLPYGVASSVPEALERMRGQGLPAEALLADPVRRASAHRGNWPTLSVWHGAADRTVDAINADAILAQWRALHALPAAPTVSDTVDGHPHRAWRDVEGRMLIEDYRIAGMGHGTPLDASGDDACGTAGAYMLDVGISSTRHLVAAWGLGDAGRAMPIAASPERADRHEPASASRPKALVAAARYPGMDWHPYPPSAHAADTPATGVGKIIEDALKASGLMK